MIDQVPDHSKCLFRLCKDACGEQFSSLDMLDVIASHASISQPGQGRQGGCDTAWEGSGLRKASVYLKLVCPDTPPSQCMLPPPCVHHAKGFRSIACGNASTPGENLMLGKASTSIANDHCEAVFDEEYHLKNIAARPREFRETASR